MTILEKAAETIQRLGSAAQDCKSCARLPMCNAYRTENRFENCDYKWVHEDEAADVQPVKRGKWLKHGKDDDYLWCCSACKKWIIYAEHDLHKHHFCGNCGADMRQEKSNGKTN